MPSLLAAHELQKVRGTTFRTLEERRAARNSSAASIRVLLDLRLPLQELERPRWKRGQGFENGAKRV